MTDGVEDCIFCKLIAGEIPSEKIYSDERTIAVLDIFPANKGHAVVIPREHTPNFFEAPEQDLNAVMVAARNVGELIKQKLAPDGFNLLSNTGAAAWQSIFHFHLHVIPRYEGDPLRLPWQPVEADPQELAAVAAELRG